MSLSLTMNAKGTRVVSRAVEIVRRFGVGSQAMERNLANYCSILAAFGARATFPVTASVLARHREALRRSISGDVELAVHGLVHNDLAALDQDEQAAQLRRAAELFTTAGVTFVGFRGPYLRSNEETLDVLREMGFCYDSSQSVLFAVTHEAAHGRRARGIQRAINLYRPDLADRVTIRPHLDRNLVRIPVALPDDEMLVDRLGLCSSQVAEIWLDMFRLARSREGLLVLQAHPERIAISGPALRSVLAEARAHRDEVWVADLATISSWWRTRAKCRLAVRQRDADTFEIEFSGDTDARLEVPASAREIASSAVGPQQRRTFLVGTKPRPTVGLSTRTPEKLRDFLTEEGFIVEAGGEPSDHAVYLDIPSRSWDERDVIQAVLVHAGRLVRIARWPGGARMALAITGDIDSMTVSDFLWRIWETR